MSHPISTPGPPERPATTGSGVARAWERVAGLNASWKYLILLVWLEALTWFFWTERRQHRSGLTMHDVAGVLTLLTAILAIGRRRWVVALGLPLAVLPLLLATLGQHYQSKPVLASAALCTAVFLGFTALIIVYDIWHTVGVRADTIIGSLCAFMLVAAAWAYVFAATELLVPGSFYSTASGNGVNSQEQLARCDLPVLLYYSLVTLCTVGYGDIIPVKNAARMLATWEVVTGQFYMAVFVARLVGLYTVKTDPTALSNGAGETRAGPRNGLS